MFSSRCRGALLTVGLAVALLAGCGTGAPIASPPPETASPTPTPSPTPRAFDDLTCADFATPGLSGLLPADTRLDRHDAWIDYQQSLGPQFAVEMVGGIVCEWISSQPATDEGSTSGRVDMVLIPFATDQFNAWMTTEYSYPTPCDPGGGSCRRDTLVGSTWVSIDAIDVPPTSFDAYATEVQEVVAGASPGAAPRVPETALTSVTCADIASGATLAASLGFTIDLATEQQQRIAGEWGAATNLAGSISCAWTVPLSPTLPLGNLSTLPGGAWAWDAMSGSVTYPSAPVALDIPGLRGGDQAWLRCNDTNEYCIIDLVLGTDWIEFRLDSRIPGAVTLFETRGSAISLATAIVANLA